MPLSLLPSPPPLAMMDAPQPLPTLTRLTLRNTQEARRLMRAVRDHRFPEYRSRLGRSPGARTAEAGDVFVYKCKTGSVLRWTDSLGPWGSSRTRKGFLCYDSQSKANRHICRKKLKVVYQLEGGGEEEWLVIAYDYNDKAPRPQDAPVLRLLDHYLGTEAGTGDAEADVDGDGGDDGADRAPSVAADTETVVTASPAHVDSDAFAMIAAAALSEQTVVPAASFVLPPFSSLKPLAGPVRTETRARHHTLPFPSLFMLRSNLPSRLNGTCPSLPLLPSPTSSLRVLSSSKRRRSHSSPAVLETVKTPSLARTSFDHEMLSRFN